MSPDPTESKARLRDLIKDIRFAMFTTRHDNGQPHSRPMTTLNSNLDEDSRLWFFMLRGGEPVAELAADPDLALGRVKITHADDWDVRESKLVQLHQMARAAFTCQPPPELGEHAGVRMG